MDTPIAGQGDDQMATGATPWTATPATPADGQPPVDDNAGVMTPPPPASPAGGAPMDALQDVPVAPSASPAGGQPMNEPVDAPMAPPPMSPTPEMPDTTDASAPAPEMPAEPTAGGVATNVGPDSVESMPDTDAAPADDATTPTA